MSPRTSIRLRLLDVVVGFVCVVCVAAPFLPSVLAADGDPAPALVENAGNVDTKVNDIGVISQPIGLTFPGGTSGTLNGSVSWDLYTTSASGLKLVLSSDRVTAMHDTRSGVDISDLDATPSAWSGSGMQFGFGVSGPMSLSTFNGSVWRGFSGKRSIEIARRTAPTPVTRTTVQLRAQLGTELASNAALAANIDATAVPNL